MSVYDLENDILKIRVTRCERTQLSSFDLCIALQHWQSLEGPFRLGTDLGPPWECQK